MKTVFIRLFLLMTAIVFMSGCGNHHASDIVHEKGTLSKTTGAAGSIVDVVDYNASKCTDGEFSIQIGNAVASGYVDEKQMLHFAVPLFYDEKLKWSNPPKGAVDVKIYCGEELVVSLPKSFVVTSLEHASGTTEKIAEDMKSQIDHFKEIMKKVVVPDSPQEQYVYAYLNAMEEMTSGGTPNSLDTLFASLKKDHPEVLELLDALNASTGVNERTKAFTDLLAEFEGASQYLTSPLPGTQKAKALSSYNAYASQFSPIAGMQPGNTDFKMLDNNSLNVFQMRSSAASPLVTFNVEDKNLAFMMQFYHMLKLFQVEVVSNVASDFATAANLAGVVASVPQVVIVNAMLTTFDLMLKKIVLSLMPANLDSISLSVNPKTVGLGEIYQSSAFVHASNKVEPMTIIDVTTALTTALGIANINPLGINNLVDTLAGTIVLYLDIVNRFLAHYAVTHPIGGNFVYDTSLYTLVPQFSFDAEAVTPKLYNFMTFPVGTDIVSPVEGQVKWRANDSDTGTARIMLMPSLKDDARIVTSFLGAEYLGGAFGEDVIASNKVEVAVGEFIVDVNGSVCMHDNDTGTLIIKIGNGTSTSFSPSANIQVDVSIIGGGSNGASTLTGLTDGNGEFTFEYSADPTVNKVDFVVDVTNPTDGSIITKNISTSIQDHCGLAIKVDLPSCFKKDESSDVTITVGEPRADGAIEGYGNIDLTFLMSRGSINGDICIATTDASGQVTVPVIPDSNIGSMDLKITAADAEGLYAEKQVTIPIVCDGNYTLTRQCHITDPYTGVTSMINSSWTYDGSNNHPVAGTFVRNGDATITTCNDLTETKYICTDTNSFTAIVDTSLPVLYLSEGVNGVINTPIGSYFNEDFEDAATIDKHLQWGNITYNHTDTSMTSTGEGGTATWTFNADRQITDRVINYPTTSSVLDEHTTWTWDGNGFVTKINDVKHEHNSDGELCTVTEITNATYSDADSDGQAEHISQQITHTATCPSGTGTPRIESYDISFTYDSHHHLTLENITHTESEGSLAMDATHSIEYTYDTSGNITEKTEIYSGSFPTRDVKTVHETYSYEDGTDHLTHWSRYTVFTNNYPFDYPLLDECTYDDTRW